MTFYGGRSVDASELIPDNGGTLGVPLHKIDNSWYSVAHNSISLYTLDRSKLDRLLPSQVGDPVFEDPMNEVAPQRQGKKYDTKPGTSSGNDDCESWPLVYWEENSDGDVPSDALFVGNDADGGRLYLGRAYIFGSLIPGKVSEMHRVCYVALEGREYALGMYEVLVVKRGTVKWVPSEGGHLPPNAIPTGFNLQGDTIYSAKAKCSGIDTPGHFIPAEGKCCISYNMEEMNFTTFDILTIQRKEKTFADILKKKLF